MASSRMRLGAAPRSAMGWIPGNRVEKTKLGQRSRDFRAANVKQLFRDKLLDYKAYINKQSLDMSKIRKRQRNPDQT